MRYNIRNHRRPQRSVRALCLAFILTLIAGMSVSNRVPGVSAQELGKLNRFLQGSNPKDDAMKIFREGRDQIEEENWNGAAAKFITFIKSYPNHKDVDAALYWMAFALKKQGKYAEANQQLERLMRKHPRSTWIDDARAMKVEIAGQTRNPQAAEKELDKNDMEMRVIALQALFQANPERAAEIIRGILGPGSTADRKLKETAIALLGQNLTAAT